MYSSSNKQTLFLREIQKKREEMCLFGKKYGLNAVETIACSQELDSLLNEYYQLFQASKYNKSSNFPRTMMSNVYVKQQKLLSAK